MKDIEDWAVPNNLDYVALSLVQSADMEKCCKHCAGKPIEGIESVEELGCGVSLELLAYKELPDGDVSNGLEGRSRAHEGPRGRPAPEPPEWSCGREPLEPDLSGHAAGEPS